MLSDTKRILTQDDYDRAFELWPTEIAKRVHNLQIEPQWLNDGTDRFWYRRETSDGSVFMLVNAPDATSVVAFDHHALAEALSQHLDRSFESLDLPITGLVFDSAMTKLEFTCLGKRYVFALQRYTLEEIGKVEFPLASTSPNDRSEVFRNGHNLWVRDTISRQEWAITSDGELHRTYGTMPDHDRMAVARSRGLIELPPVGVFWSPDARQILALRCDEREVEDYVFLESAPADGSFRPIAHQVKIPFPGDRFKQKLDYVLLATDGSGQIELVLPPDWHDLTLDLAETAVLKWTVDGRSIHAIASTSDRKRAAIVAIDRCSGECRIVFEETCGTFFDFNAFDYHRPNVEFLDGDQSALWYSQRSGWGQLYLVDLENGAIERQVTKGDWPVLDIIRADPSENVVFFLAGSLDRTENPYHRHLCRCEIFGAQPNAGFRQLTEPGFDHAIAARPLHLMGLLTGTVGRDSLSPSGRYFVDNRSTVDQPTVTSIVTTNGELVGRFSRADTAELYATGWVPPTPFDITVEEGSDPVWGVIIRPRGWDGHAKLPIVERIYAGPQMVAQPRSFSEAITGAFIYGAYALAEFGFAVVLTDTQGTPYRSKAWHDAPYGQADRLNLCQHAAVLNRLADRLGNLNSGLVGINGHSWGGHAAAMGMLLAGDTYKVGVSSAGIYDPAAFFTDASEKALGRPVYSDGTSVRGDAREEADNYMRMSPSTYAKALSGKLMLAYGDLDENALPASALRFAAALVRAKKTFELLCVPGAGHALFADPYFQTRMMNFFVTHLRGDVTLDHYVPDVVAGSRALI